MQDVRNVRSRGNTWPWQHLSNAELVFFGFVFTCFYKMTTQPHCNNGTYNNTKMNLKDLICRLRR